VTEISVRELCTFELAKCPFGIDAMAKLDQARLSPYVPSSVRLDGRRLTTCATEVVDSIEANEDLNASLPKPSHGSDVPKQTRLVQVWSGHQRGNITWSEVIDLSRFSVDYVEPHRGHNQPKSHEYRRELVLVAFEPLKYGAPPTNGTRRRARGMLSLSRRRVSTVENRAAEPYG